MGQRYGISIGNILHPTDFSRGSDVAFAHALRLAVGAHGKLEILHVEREQTRAQWDSYPSVRTTLSRWKLLPSDAKRSDVADLGVHISKSACKGQEPLAGVLEHLEHRGADLVVMATHQREGLARLLHSSLAESVSNQSDAAALFVPYGVDGFVNVETGHVSLNRILVPIDATPDPQPVIDAVSDLVTAIAQDDVEVRLLHIGDPSGMPAPTLPVNEKCHWKWESAVGSVVDAICEDAVQNEVDLIAMTTNGRDGFLDALRGSTTERVLQKAGCPVLSVHAAGR
ncbi:MAG: universal stress protein [Planctomycetaceae bacterium]